MVIRSIADSRQRSQQWQDGFYFISIFFLICHLFRLQPGLPLGGAGHIYTPEPLWNLRSTRLSRCLGPLNGPERQNVDYCQFLLFPFATVAK